MMLTMRTSQGGRDAVTKIVRNNTLRFGWASDLEPNHFSGFDDNPEGQKLAAPTFQVHKMRYFAQRFWAWLKVICKPVNQGMNLGGRLTNKCENYSPTLLEFIPCQCTDNW